MKTENRGVTPAESASFLVRFWREPRREGVEVPVLRGFVRNLKTGEERYLAGPEQLADHLRRSLERSARTPAAAADGRAAAGR